jgi:hypothetical protein
MSYAYLSTVCWKPPVHIVLIYNKKLRCSFNSKPMQFATCVSSKALNTAPALHYRFRCISPHLEQLEMLLIHCFMLDSSIANTMFHWYCSVTKVYYYQEIWPTTWLLLFLLKKIKITYNFATSK